MLGQSQVVSALTIAAMRGTFQRGHHFLKQATLAEYMAAAEQPNRGLCNLLADAALA